MRCFSRGRIRSVLREHRVRRVSQRLDATVHGVVQGVGYRWFVVAHAARLGLTGWVANESDGSVRIVAEGSPAALDQLVNALWQGPAGASVARVDEARLQASGEFGAFGIRSGAHRGD